MSRTHKPNEIECRQVEALAGYGVPEADIARVLAIAPKTLRKHYREELDTGHVKANAKVAENLYRQATGEGRSAVTAAIFWLKTRARWKETSVHEVSGPEGEPVEFDFPGDTREKLAMAILHSLHQKAAAAKANLLPPTQSEPAEQS